MGPEVPSPSVNGQSPRAGDVRKRVASGEFQPTKKTPFGGAQGKPKSD
jgi:hypothetical protein